MRYPRIALAAAGLATLLAAAAAAQPEGSVTGTITDGSGAPIGLARVELVTPSGPPREATTDAAGRYRIDGLAAGGHRLRVTAEGFRPVERSFARTAGVESSVVDVQLALAAFSQSVEVVAATGYARSASELPLSASVVTRETARATAARTVDGLLRHVASVQLQGDDADAVHPLVPSLAMRGIGIGDTADRGLVLLDGLPLNSGFYGNVAWNRAPKETIERVEVVRGASSSLFGSFAMGGVVDVVTRTPQERETALELQYGEYRRVQANLFHAGPIGEAWRYALNGSLADTDGYLRVPEEEKRPVDEPLASTLANVQGRVAGRLGEGLRGFVRLGYNDQARDGGYQTQSADSDVFDAAAGLDWALGGGGALDLRLMYAGESFDVRNVRVVDDTTAFVSNPHLTTSDDFGVSARWSKPLSGVVANVSAGADLRRIDGSDEQDVFNQPGELTSHIEGGGVQTSAGLFAQVSLRPSARSEILAGLRVDHFDNSDGRIVTDGVPADFEERDFTVASPRLAARVRVADAWTLRGAYFQGFRAPTLAELYRSFETPTFRGLSNPDLQEERLKGGDLGIELARGRVSAQLNAFYNRLENFVGSAEVGFVNGKFTVQATNVAAVRSQGVEVMATLRITGRFAIDGNYTFTDSEVVEGELEGNAVEGAPRNAFSLSLLYADAATSVSLRSRYQSETYQDITNEAPQDARFIVDLRAERRVHRGVSLFVVGENLFDEQYVADGFGASLGAPRQLSAGITARF
jgi:outer membrane receptor protein involved in Fe transport